MGDAESNQTAQVDLSLIDEALKMSPLERLEYNDRMVNMVEELRAGFAQKDHG